MPKVTLNRDMFKALASDTRLDILRVLDGKKMGLNDISKATKLNKATLHEHLTKLHEAGLVNRHERDGHKWVYYDLSWKGESLLHPENTRIVVMFATTFFLLVVGIFQMVLFLKGKIVDLGFNVYEYDSGTMMMSDSTTNTFFEEASRKCGEINLPPSLAKLFCFKTTPTFETKGFPVGPNSNLISTTPDGGDILGVPEGSQLFFDHSEEMVYAISQNPLFLYLGIALISIFVVLLCVTLWRYWENQSQKI